MILMQTSVTEIRLGPRPNLPAGCETIGPPKDMLFVHTIMFEQTTGESRKQELGGGRMSLVKKSELWYCLYYEAMC